MSFKKFIKKNSVPLMLFVLLLVIIIAVVLFIGMFVPSNKNGIYGNRLDGIEEYAIENATWEKIESLATEKDFSKVTTRLKGRVIYVHLYTTLEREKAKKASEVIFEAFSAEQKLYYDFDIVIHNESEEEGKSYIMFGSRNHSALGEDKEALETVWTNYSEGGSDEKK